jgi:CBS domain-containing protein
MRADDVMATALLTVTPTTTIDVAIALMLKHHVSGLPVVDTDGKLVGILTEGDLLRRAETGTSERHRSRFLEFLLGPGRDAQSYVQTNSRQVGDLMTHDVVTVTPSTPLDVVVEAMEHHRIRRVCVAEGKRLVGLVSRADLLRALSRKLADVPTPDLSDAEIEKTLQKELAAAHWAAGSSITVRVQDRIVTFEGFIYDERMRKALHVAAQNTPGVAGIVDQLVWLDTTTGMTIPAQ